MERSASRFGPGRHHAVNRGANHGRTASTSSPAGARAIGATFGSPGGPLPPDILGGRSAAARPN